jgi:hypothetical protein
MIRVNPLVASALVIAFTLFVFRRARVDYEVRGKLTPLSAILLTAKGIDVRSHGGSAHGHRAEGDRVVTAK